MLECTHGRVSRYHRVIRSRKSKKERQHNVKRKQGKRTNNDLQNTTTENQRPSTTNPLKTEWTRVLWKGEQYCSCFTSGTRNVLQNSPQTPLQHSTPRQQATTPLGKVHGPCISADFPRVLVIQSCVWFIWFLMYLYQSTVLEQLLLSWIKFVIVSLEYL